MTVTHPSVPPHLRVLVLPLLLTLSGNAPTHGDEAAKTDEAGFVSIFDGKTLDGWDGDPVYWRVEAGHLVGEITPKTVVKRNTFLIVYMDRQFLRQGTGPRNAAPPGARPDHKCPVSITPSTA